MEKRRASFARKTTPEWVWVSFVLTKMAFGYGYVFRASLAETRAEFDSHAWKTKMINRRTSPFEPDALPRLDRRPVGYLLVRYSSSAINVLHYGGLGDVLKTWLLTRRKIKNRRTTYAIARKRRNVRCRIERKNDPLTTGDYGYQ